VSDVQVDFCPGGSLAVAGGDDIVETINAYVQLFIQRALPVFATRDWHPAETTHFSRFGGQWPVHCVQGSRGAQFHPGLRLPPHATIVSKGDSPQRDDYSPFQVTDDSGGTFVESLKRSGVSHLYLCGLATDYCVRWTALDALGAGFRVTVLIDAVKGVDLSPGDSQHALEEIVAAGGETADLHSIQGTQVSKA
jgi:nicotinamidase/pyrazinamidase